MGSGIRPSRPAGLPARKAGVGPRFPTRPPVGPTPAPAGAASPRTGHLVFYFGSIQVSPSTRERVPPEVRTWPRQPVSAYLWMMRTAPAYRLPLRAACQPSRRSVRVATSLCNSSVFSPSLLRAMPLPRGAAGLQQLLQLLVGAGLQEVPPQLEEAVAQVAGPLQFIGGESSGHLPRRVGQFERVADAALAVLPPVPLGHDGFGGPPNDLFQLLRRLLQQGVPFAPLLHLVVVCDVHGGPPRFAAF